MNFLLSILMFLPVFFLERSWGQEFSFFGITPPLVLMFIFLSFWKLPIYQRLALAAVLGFWLDSVSLYPFGTNLVLLLVAGMAIEFLHREFLKAESFITRLISAGFFTFLFSILIPFWGYVLNFLGGEASFIYADVKNMFLGSLSWAVILPAAIAIIFGAGKRIFKIWA